MRKKLKGKENMQKFSLGRTLVKKNVDFSDNGFYFYFKSYDSIYGTFLSGMRLLTSIFVWI